jgi:hypothetical protein
MALKVPGAESSGRVERDPESLPNHEPRTTNQYITAPNIFSSEGICALNGFYLKHLNAVFTLFLSYFFLDEKVSKKSRLKRMMRCTLVNNRML